MSPGSSFQTLSYNRHNLTADTSERQAKEILIRRRHSLRESVRKDSSLNREHRVRRFAPLGAGGSFSGARSRPGSWRRRGAGPRSPGVEPMVAPSQGVLRHLSSSRRCRALGIRWCEQNYKAPFLGRIHIPVGGRPPETAWMRKLLC